jgi:hypothetical protein
MGWLKEEGINMEEGRKKNIAYKRSKRQEDYKRNIEIAYRM